MDKKQKFLTAATLVTAALAGIQDANAHMEKVMGWRNLWHRQSRKK